MLGSDLARKLAEQNPHLYPQDIDRIVKIVLGGIVIALRDGGRVELRGFGAFSVRVRNPRMGRNPHSGAPVAVAAKRAPAFRCSRKLHARLNRPGP